MGKIKNVFENGFIKKEMYIRFKPYKWNFRLINCKFGKNLCLHEKDSSFTSSYFQLFSNASNSLNGG